MSSRKRGSNSRRQQLTSAKQVVENEDLLIEILKRLPVKSLLRFRRVCKHWRTLISSFEFRRTWSSLPRDLKPTGFLFCGKKSSKISKFLYLGDKIPARRKSPYRDFPFCKVKIIQSRNGLILCSRGPSVRTPTNICFVCNPITKEVVKLRIPGGGDGGRLVFPASIGLAFDPKISPHYKVLCLNLYARKLYVYSSEFRDWRIIEVTVPMDDTTMSHQAYYKGVMYWMDRLTGCGIRFNIENDNMEILTLPRTMQEDPWSRFCYMGVCADILYLVESYFHRYMYYIVHEMELNGSGWVVKHRINFDREVAIHLSSVPRYIVSGGILCIYQDENGELGMVFSVSDEIVAYCFRNMNVKKFRWSGSSPCFIAFEHLETFYSV